MTKLTILRGVSGSGKSTWAESQAGNPVIVSRDRIRMSMFGTENFIDEDLVTKVEHQMITSALRGGRDVISDNTNIQMRYVNPIAKIGYAAGAEVELKVFDISLDKAIDRNNYRAAVGGRNVPNDVIRKQHAGFQGTKNHDLTPTPALIPYNGTPGKPKAFMVDIDGTLAHMKNRGPFEWHRVGEDRVDKAVADVVYNLGDSGDYQIIFMSGRDEVCRQATYNWLEDNVYDVQHLFMRPERDMRADNIVKAELFDKYVRDNFDVQFVIDDRWQVCQMWLQMGLKVLNVSGLDRGEF